MRSPERARELGEVFTPEHVVNDVLDLVGDLGYSSTYLEPGCGSGNFLVQILNRKFRAVRELPEVKQGLKSNTLLDVEVKSLIALASIYGVDISPINIEESKERMFRAFCDSYLKLTKLSMIPDNFAQAITRIISQNIILGDMLNRPHEIEIFEYAELPGHKVKMRIFILSDLIFPESEVFDETPQLFGHVPQSIRDLPAMTIHEIGDLLD